MNPRLDAHAGQLALMMQRYWDMAQIGLFASVAVAVKRLSIVLWREIRKLRLDLTILYGLKKKGLDVHVSSFDVLPPSTDSPECGHSPSESPPPSNNVPKL